jgi:N-methylhydantoinase B
VDTVDAVHAGARAHATGCGFVVGKGEVEALVEALEYAYPFRVRSYSYRKNSGGAGEFKGGDGIIREVELLSDAQVTLLGDRRRFQPYGLSGGEAGKVGLTLRMKQDGSSEMLPAKTSIYANKHDLIHLETPGGGGWGTPNPL